MRVHRFLVAVVLCGAAVLSGATAGCGVVTARWSDPKPEAPATMPADQDGTADDPPPPRRNSLEMSAETLYFLEGKLPTNQYDGTTAAFGGTMTLRAQCHDGTLKVVITGPTGVREMKVSCDGTPHEKAMGKVDAGDPLSVAATGKAGTDFAIELAALK